MFLQYVDKCFVLKLKDSEHLLSIAEQLWESVRINDVKAVYRLIVVSGANINAVYGRASCLSLANVIKLENPDECRKSLGLEEDVVFEGCSLIHLACQIAEIGMVELLLQHGANMGACDSKGQTPLHHSIARGRTGATKLLLRRYYYTLLCDVMLLLWCIAHFMK